MLACVKAANGRGEMMDLPVPAPGPGQAVVKTTLATICGTDMHFSDEIAKAYDLFRSKTDDVLKIAVTP